MFTRVIITLANGRILSIDAPDASTPNRYVQTLRVSGVHAPSACAGPEWRCPWLPASAIASGAQLRFELGDRPNRAWGSASAAAPPSITQPHQ